MRKLKSSAGTFSIAEMSDLAKTIPTPTLLSGQDLDDLKTPGVYYFSGNDMTNLPTGMVNYGVIIVLRAAGTVFRQIVTGYASKVFMRNSSGDDWGEWYKYEGTSLS